jgi:hypothetical protein
VIWSNESEIQIEVRVDTTPQVDDTFIQQTVNYAYFSFRFDTPLRKQVMPQLYDEAMKVYFEISCLMSVYSVVYRKREEGNKIVEELPRVDKIVLLISS